METGLSETIGILRGMAATDKANMELNALKVQISAFLVWSAAHTRALALLEKYASERYWELEDCMGCFFP